MGVVLVKSTYQYHKFMRIFTVLFVLVFQVLTLTHANAQTKVTIVILDTIIAVNRHVKTLFNGSVSSRTEI